MPQRQNATPWIRFSVKVLLIDSSKFGVVKTAYFADLEDFDIVITDTGIPEDYEKFIQKAGITLYKV